LFLFEFVVTVAHLAATYWRGAANESFVIHTGLVCSPVSHFEVHRAACPPPPSFLLLFCAYDSASALLFLYGDATLSGAMFIYRAKQNGAFIYQTIPMTTPPLHTLRERYIADDRTGRSRRIERKTKDKCRRAAACGYVVIVRTDGMLPHLHRAPRAVAAMDHPSR
jgi:hypothetical protein